MTQAYPLHWPDGRPRRRPIDRKRANFGRSEQRAGSNRRSKEALSVADALRRLQFELDCLGAQMPVVSSNVELRLDGLPRSSQREPEDPGVCVYFQLAGEPVAMPCDTYDRVADNIAAVAAHIAATRAIERYGVATMAEMFRGFMSLPAPGAKRPWREVMGFRPDHRPTRAELDEKFRALAKTHHPDTPSGSHEAMAALNAAYEDAKMTIGEGR